MQPRIMCYYYYSNLFQILFKLQIKRALEEFSTLTSHVSFILLIAIYHYKFFFQHQSMQAAARISARHLDQVNSSLFERIPFKGYRAAEPAP
jgi:hypothetical protein